MTGVVEDPELGAGDPLGEDLGVGDRNHAVLTAVDDERRRLDAMEPAVAVVQRGGDHLRAVGVLGERVREPAPDVLRDAVLVLAPAAWPVVERHRRARRILGRHARPAAEEGDHVGARPHRARAARVRRSQHDRAHPVGVPERQLLRDHPAQREAVHVRLVDAGGVEDRDGVVGHRLHGVAVQARVRPAHAAVVEGDDAKRPRQHRDACATRRPR